MVVRAGSSRFISDSHWRLPIDLEFNPFTYSAYANERGVLDDDIMIDGRRCGLIMTTWIGRSDIIRRSGTSIGIGERPERHMCKPHLWLRMPMVDWQADHPGNTAVIHRKANCLLSRRGDTSTTHRGLAIAWGAISRNAKWK